MKACWQTQMKDKLLKKKYFRFPAAAYYLFASTICVCVCLLYKYLVSWQISFFV